MTKEGIALILAVILTIFIIVVVFKAIGQAQTYQPEQWRPQYWIYVPFQPGDRSYADQQYRLLERWSARTERRAIREMRRRWNR